MNNLTMIIQKRIQRVSSQKDANAFCVIQLKKLTEFNKKVENLH